MDEQMSNEQLERRWHNLEIACLKMAHRALDAIAANEDGVDVGDIPVDTLGLPLSVRAHRLLREDPWNNGHLDPAWLLAGLVYADLVRVHLLADGILVTPPHVSRVDAMALDAALQAPLEMPACIQ